MSLLVNRLGPGVFDTHVCAMGCGGPLEKELRRGGADVKVMECRGLLDPLAFWQLCRHAKRLQPTIVHSWGADVRLFGHAAASACVQARHIVGIQCPEPRQLWLDRFIDHRIARSCQQVVVNSPSHRDTLADRGLAGQKLRVIPNGVPQCKPSRITRRQLLDSLDLPEGCRLVSAVGRLDVHKRLKDAIWAADLLKVIRDDVHLLIIGDGSHASRLYKFRDQVEIRDKVHFLGGRDDVPDLLPHLDVFWSVASRAGQSRSILEAMAAGVPVVATDIPGTRELVRPDSTGYLVPLGDRAGIARETNRLLGDAELAKRLGDAGRQRALNEFSEEKMLRGYEALYSELL